MSTKETIRKKVKFLVLHFTVLLSLLGCGGGTDSNGKEDADTGTIAFALKWIDLETPSFDNATRALNPDGTINCQGSAVDRIFVGVYNTDGELLRNNGSEGWDCEAHSGVLSGIQAGLNRSMVVSGQNSSGETQYRGVQDNFPVIAGETTELSQVILYDFVPNLTDPIDSAVVINGGFDFRWSAVPGAIEYRIIISTDGDLGNPVYDNITTGTVFSPTDLSFDTTYYWSVCAIDAQEHESAFAVVRSFSIEPYANFPPVLEPIGNKSVGEGELLEFIVSATDSNNDNLIYSIGNLPTGAGFDPVTRTFSWTPDYGDEGNYDVIFTVTDDGSPIQSTSESITITVNNANRPPILDLIGPKTAQEGVLLEFTVSGSDPDNNGIIFSAGNLPTGSSFDQASGTFSWTPGYGDSGNHDVLFIVTDTGSLQDSETVTITVGDINRSPVLNTIGPKSGDEAVLLEFTISGTDPDGDLLFFSAENLPSGATFIPGDQRFSWTPDYGDAANYNVNFIVTDDGVPNLSDSETVTLSIGDVNRPPVLNPIGSRVATEGELLSIVVSGSDPDGNTLTFSTNNLPSGAVFTPASQTLTWTPALGAARDYPGIEFVVEDDGVPVLTDSETITITVQGLYFDNLDGTVTDTTNGLRWTKQRQSTSTIDWYSALDYCNAFETPGRSEWRVPYIAELRTLLTDEIDEGVETNIEITGFIYYWSRTYRPTDGAPVDAMYALLYDPDTYPPYEYEYVEDWRAIENDSHFFCVCDE